MLIELDDDLTETGYVRCTCLDRARIALEQTGQIHCSMIMGRLQIAIDDIAMSEGLNSNKPVEIVRYLFAVLLEETDAEDIWYAEAQRGCNDGRR
jgi:hypothetical protein